MDSHKYTHLSLFSGLGGLDIAAHWAGFETVGFCEWAPYQHGVMTKRFPGVPGWYDIRSLTKESFHARTGLHTVDLVSGGFPCQPFSSAGQRKGKNDDRYLWPEMLRVVTELRPTFVIGENVAGILSMVEPEGKPVMVSKALDIEKGEEVSTYDQMEQYTIGRILSDLEQIGYAVRLFVFPAGAVNAPHRRDRICIVGRDTHGLGERTDRAPQKGADT